MDYTKVAPMWAAALDPRVLNVVVRKAPHGSGVDFGRFAPRVVRNVVVEHVRVAVHGEIFRLDFVNGTVLDGPVHLIFLLEHDTRLTAQIQTVRRFIGRLDGRSLAPLSVDRRVRHAMSALAAWDARLEGKSLKVMADELFGPGEWPGPGEYRKSAVRRLVALGQRLVTQGATEILAW